jgi:capsular polysaccharide biosynthesis protein
MESQVLDFRRAMAAIGRRWVVLLIPILGGMGVGAFVIVVSTPTYRARARVLLPPSTVDSKGNDLRDPKTEAYIIASPQVLEPAGKYLKPPRTAQALRSQIHVRAVSSQIEEVAADAPSPNEAVAVANAVARASVAANDRAASGTGDLSTSFLTDQVSHLNEQIRTLNDQITGDTATLKKLSPADAQREASVIDSLRSQEASLTQQLIAIQGRIADAQLSTQLTRQGTRLLQPASPPRQPQGLRPPLLLGAGALGGLLAGAVLILALEQGDRRLRLRDEIAVAAGAPVLASLSVSKSTSERACRDTLERWQPGVVENEGLRQTFTRLDLAAGSAANLVVVTVAGDTAAGLLALELACYAARTSRTAFIFGAHHPSTATLRAACLAVATAGAMRPGLVVYGAGDDEPVDLGGFDLIVTSIVAEPGPLTLPTWNRRTVVTLAVSSGTVTGRALEGVSLSCLEADQPAVGVFLANPADDDPTTGRTFPRPEPSIEQLALNRGPRDVTLALNAGSGTNADANDESAAQASAAAKARAAAAAFASLKAARAAEEAAQSGDTAIGDDPEGTKADVQPMAGGATAPATRAGMARRGHYRSRRRARSR